ncbi:MAG: tRNA (adenosine(37)-N6)-threonylcarbamoyltransferase complex transferase subunit TsaD [Candidatus Paceibacterota bacterium]
MRILAIETSCDETAVSLLDITSPSNFSVLGTGLLSQADLHSEYGGVFPTLAKREHAKNLVPMLLKALTEAQALPEKTAQADAEKISQITEILLPREPLLLDSLLAEIIPLQKPTIDAIAVTTGPGLEPALWVGINFARALSVLWSVPVIPVNHMEGHLFSILNTTETLTFPALALLVSGGHTELIFATKWGDYTRIGKTRDDAVGEAFDKVARILGFSYPGGPEISKHALRARAEHIPSPVTLPRPMKNSADFDFSFSGLKTAVLYALRDNTFTADEKDGLAREFEDSAIEVLTHKTLRALKEKNARTLIVAGGVSANTKLKETFIEKLSTENITLLFPEKNLSTDNAVMIGLAGFIRSMNQGEEAYVPQEALVANGNLDLTE